MKETTRVSLNELATNLPRIFERVVRERKKIVVEKKGSALAVIAPIRIRRPKPRRISAADHKAFLASAGGWKDLVDAEKFKRDNDESHRISSRPLIAL